MSSQHCGNPCQSPELTHLLGLPPRVLNPRTQRAPEPSFIGRGGQPPALQCPTVSPPLFLLPKAVGPKPCEGAPFCGQPLRPPPGNRDPGNNSVLFPQDPLFPLFISSKVSAAHTHMCMQIHMHTNTHVHAHIHMYTPVLLLRATHTQTCTYTYVHTHIAPLAHSWCPLFAHFSWVQDQPLCSLDAGKQDLSLSGCPWNFGGGTCCSWALSMLFLRGWNSNIV